MVNLRELKNKKIAFLGLGIENYALIKFLFGKKIKADFTICDFRSKEQLGEKYKELNKAVETPRLKVGASLQWKLGKSFNQGLGQFDILFRSPGWPLDCPGVREALQTPLTPLVRGAGRTLLYSPIRLFFDLCPSKNIIGVSGTKGKGTTASLIYAILKAAGRRVWLGGNIGTAPFSFINKIKPSDWVALELSSFQLEDLTVSPKVAVITNFYPEHLSSADPHNPNFHQTLSAYWQAKLNIIKRQKKGDLAIINKKLENRNLKFGKAKKVFFTKSNLPTSLPGEHNKENIAAAEAVARFIRIKPAVITEAVSRFKGLEHRLESVRVLRGVKYYNDSFATTPEAAITALRSFSEPIALLAGGAEKKSNFRRLAKEIKKRVKFVVLLKGKATPRLKKELLKIGYAGKLIKEINNIKAAVSLASRQAQAGEIVLLSTACASFGMFKNYKERGRLFKKAVKKLK